VTAADGVVLADKAKCQGVLVGLSLIIKSLKFFLAKAAVGGKNDGVGKLTFETCSAAMRVFALRKYGRGAGLMNGGEKWGVEM